MLDKFSNIFDFTSAKLTYYSSFSFLSFFNLSESDEKGKFFPERGDENLETASLFCNSSNNFILRFTFLFPKSISDMAASILSPPTNLEGLASAEFIAICDFFITIFKSEFSGLTVNPLLSEDITFTVTISLTFLFLK